MEQALLVSPILDMKRFIELMPQREHEIGFMPGAVSTNATGFRKEPKYINKMVAPTMESVKSIGGMRTLPDYSFETMPADYAALGPAHMLCGRP